VKNIVNSVTVTTGEFSVTGIVTGVTLPVKGAFFVDGVKVTSTEKGFDKDVEAHIDSFKWDQTTLTATSKITYKVYTVDTTASPQDTDLDFSNELKITVIDTTAGPAATGLTGTDLTTVFAPEPARDYLVKNIANSVTVTTGKFDVTGIRTGSAVPDDNTLPVKGAFFVDDVKVISTEKGFDKDVEDHTEFSKWDQDALTETSIITYKVYTVDNAASPSDTDLDASEKLTITVFDLKDGTEEAVVIVHESCEATFTVTGPYSNPPLRSFCGFTEAGDFKDDPSDTSLEEGKASFDSSRTDTQWVADTTDADYTAWKLTDAVLNVKNTAKDAVLGAKCMFWWDDKSDDFKEIESTEQAIKVDAKHRCEVNPLKAVAKNYTDTTVYEAVKNATNCWTDEVNDIEAKMTCTGSDNSYTVFCEDGEYMARKGSEDKAEAWNEDKAKTWADETCGTAGILPMSLLVGALALLASRA